jgi:hypothetical protein
MHRRAFEDVFLQVFIFLRYFIIRKLMIGKYMVELDSTRESCLICLDMNSIRLDFRKDKLTWFNLKPT